MLEPELSLSSLGGVGFCWYGIPGYQVFQFVSGGAGIFGLGLHAAAVELAIPLSINWPKEKQTRGLRSMHVQRRPSGNSWLCVSPWSRLEDRGGAGSPGVAATPGPGER